MCTFGLQTHINRCWLGLQGRLLSFKGPEKLHDRLEIVRLPLLIVFSMLLFHLEKLIECFKELLVPALLLMFHQKATLVPLTPLCCLKVASLLKSYIDQIRQLEAHQNRNASHSSKQFRLLLCLSLTFLGSQAHFLICFHQLL